MTIVPNGKPTFETSDHSADSNRAVPFQVNPENHAVFPLKTILLPTDYSVASEHALSLAHHLALTQGARLLGLHVMDPDPNRWVKLREDSTEEAKHAAPIDLGGVEMDHSESGCRPLASLLV